MDRKLALVAAVILAGLLAASVAEAVVYSLPVPAQFNVTQDTIRLNWTTADTGRQYEANITIWRNDTAIPALIAAVINNTHTVLRNYTQPGTENDWATGTSGYGSASCGSTGAQTPLFVKNGTDVRTNITIPLTTANENLTVLFSAARACPPGRYYGLLNVTNSTNATHYANITVIMDIPIDANNSLSTSGATNGVGQFRGKLDINESEDHRYYFNTSAIVNATSVTVNITWAGHTNDVDLFLFDENNVFLTGSSGRNLSETLTFMYPQAARMFNVRVYGNNTTSQIDYQGPGGFLIYGTLNATNASTSATLNRINFTGLAPSERHTVNIVLTNTGSINQTNVTEASELYLMQRFSSNAPTGAQNFTLRVPDFVTKIDARLNWTGGVNYTLRLIKPDGTLVGTSSNKSHLSNKTGSVSEEFVTFTPSGATIGFDDDGTWTVEVANNTAGPVLYNVTAKLFINASAWIMSNYTTRTFNQTGLTNNYGTHQINLTAQNDTLSGEVGGRLRYTSLSGAIHDIPLNSTVVTAELMVNSTYNRSTITITDNIGVNRTGLGSILLNISVNNTGNADLTFDARANSTGLNLTSNSSKFLDFSTTDPTGTLSANTGSNLNLTITADTLETLNTEGLYVGWVTLNDTGARPYQTFNLTVRVNLTSEIDVRVRDALHVGNNEIENVTQTNNITVAAEVFYKNGTEITDMINATGNFTVYIFEGNTSTRYPSSGTLNVTNESITSTDDVPLLQNGRYEFNATLPPDSARPGGYYSVFVGASDVRLGTTLKGNGTNSTIRVNNSGLYFVAIDSTSVTVADNSVAYFNFSVRNLGTFAPGGFINISTNSNLVITPDAENSTACTDGTKVGNGFRLESVTAANSIDPDGTEVCRLAFKLDPNNVTSSTSATLTISATGEAADYGDLSISLTITDADSSSSSSSSSSSDSSSDTTADEAAAEETAEEDVLDIASYPADVEIVQGGNKSVDIGVKNTGDTTQSGVELAVEGVDASWFGVDPESVDILADETVTFAVSYAIPADAAIGEHAITYKASNADNEGSVTATLTVQPSNETKAKIEATYAAKLQNITTVETRINDLSKRGYNLTEANATLAELKEKMRLAGEAIASGDYIEANALLAEADELLSKLHLQLAEAVPASGTSLLLIAGIVVAVAVGGLVVYMFLPPAKQATTVGGFTYGPPDGGSPLERAKQRLKALVEKIKQKLPKKKTGVTFNVPQGGQA
ncbi:MAG: hypothetical protein HYS81_04290 [Candidatus Aenigmatarchaeota archaeon]|nr:MAG: hypothetical protein HYS81_04290 [Candidatus Aenigmarchaeota archaeon]